MSSTKCMSNTPCQSAKGPARGRSSWSTARAILANVRTTPDGREGWKQHFLRKGFTVYVVDQVGRARSGWNTEPINQALTKGDASLIPKGGIVQFTYERAWGVFRFGPKPDEWWPDSKFPKDYLDQYMAQLVPNTEATLPQPPRKTVDALVTLLSKIGPAMVMVHSQSGILALRQRWRAPIWSKPLSMLKAALGVTLRRSSQRLWRAFPVECRRRPWVEWRGRV